MLEKDKSKKHKLTFTDDELKMIIESIEAIPYKGIVSHIITSVREKISERLEPDKE